MYNIEQYIQYCLDSCLNQDDVRAKDYEVIVVNDGSTDNSLSIAETFVRRFENIRIISQNNAGLSVARNTGLKEARGEYVWFVDGDDAIASNAVSILIEAMHSSNADAYLFNFSTFKKTQMIDTSKFETYPELSGKQIHEKYMRILPMMAWLTVYRRDALIDNNLCFLSGIYHEDKEFSVRAHHCMQSISFIENSLYYYRLARNDSIMSKTRIDNTKSLVSEIKIIDSFCAFFKEEDTPFVHMLLGMCATSFMIRRYDSAFVYNNTTRALWKDNKGRLYKLMWCSGQLRRRALVVFIITMPRFVVSLVLRSLGNRSKLM